MKCGQCGGPHFTVTCMHPPPAERPEPATSHMGAQRDGTSYPAQHEPAPAKPQRTPPAAPQDSAARCKCGLEWGHDGSCRPSSSAARSPIAALIERVLPGDDAAGVRLPETPSRPIGSGSAPAQSLWTSTPDTQAPLPDGARLVANPSPPDDPRSRAFDPGSSAPGDALACAGDVSPAAGVRIHVRREVAALALLMEQKLRENDHKSHWSHEEPSWLLRRLHEEADELGAALAPYMLDVPPTPTPEDRESIGREAADVANFAMMIADVCGALAPPKAPK